MAERDAFVWYRGAIRPAGEARLPVSDHAVQFGAGLFETFRTWQGRAPFLGRHLARLRSGCARYRIVPPSGALLPRAERALPGILGGLLERHGWSDAVFRYTVTAGEAPPGLPAKSYRHPAEIISVRRLPEAPMDGWRLHVLETRRLPPEFVPRPKSLQYANALAARWEMLDRGLGAESEGLMLTADGLVAEGVTTSVFFQAGDCLCTAALDLGVLPGVMRGLVLEWAGQEGIAVREGPFSIRALAESGAVILTSGVIGVAPVTRVLDGADRILATPPTVEHPWFHRLRARLQREISTAQAWIGV